MKKILMFAFVFLSLSFSSWADIIYPDGSKPVFEPYEIKKLSRGFANVLLAPLEFPKTVMDIGREEGILSTEQISLSLFRAPYRFGIRAASGLNDLFYWGEGNERSLFHLEPETLRITDALPTYEHQFDWENIDTPAHR